MTTVMSSPSSRLSSTCEPTVTTPPAATERGLLHCPMNCEGGELLRDVRRGAVRAVDLLVAPDELLEMRLALHADVLVDRHGGSLALQSGVPGIHYGAGATPCSHESTSSAGAASARRSPPACGSVTSISSPAIRSSCSSASPT